MRCHYVFKIKPIMRKIYLILPIFILIINQLIAQCYNGSPTVNNPTNYNVGLSIEANFNNARRWEEVNLGLPANCLGNMTEPVIGWTYMSDDEIALYIHNSERMARGFLPFYGIEIHLDAVAQAHTDWQITNDVFSHGGNPAFGTTYTYKNCINCTTNITGSSPFDRMNYSTPLKNQWQMEAENIASNVTSGSSIADFVAQGIYRFIYQDGGSAWGHRLNVLVSFTNDWGDSGNEGFLGIGVAGGSNFQACAYSCTNWNYAKILTVNYYDPQGGASGFNFGALPTEILVFDAYLQDDFVNLNWTMENKNSVEYFVIEKSLDNNNFVEIGKKESNFYSQNTNNYHFIDRELNNKTLYYRLKIVNKDNNYNYSATRFVEINKHGEIIIFPNPISDYLNISFYNTVDKASISIIDYRGRLIYEDVKNDGSNFESIDLSTLESGIYLLQVTTSTDSKIFKIIK